MGTKGYWENPRGRVYLIKNDKVIQPPTLKNLPPDPVTTLFKDSHNNIWIGFSGKGLYKLSRNKLISFSSKGKLPTSNIRNILEDKSGNIWIMTRYKGVYKYSNGKFINYSVKNGLNSNWVLSGVQDKEGTIWFNTDKGVSGYDGKIFRKLTYGGELMSGEMWASAVDQKGKLWFANSNYIFILKPNRMKKVISNSKLYIENFLVNDKRPESDFYSTHTLNFNENTVEIYFNCVNYFNGLKIKYRYKLVGLTKNWSIATTRNYIKFHNLSPGEYKFIVSSKLPGNNWCDVNSDVSFIIEAPFWQRIWFLILSSIAFIGSILLVTFLIYRYKLNQFLKIQQMREQIASDLHDDIGTNLTTISILSDIAKNKINIDTEKVYNFLDKIGNNARQVIDSMSDIVWVIKPGTDSLDMLIEKLNSIAFEILQIKGIQIDFKCDKRIEKLKLSMDVRKNLLLLFKEIINNIAKYSNASTVKILFSLKTSNEKSAKRLIL
ncbi:MAG TPA: hypothetical protein ENI61_06440, partial [Ignavibacteria bacterium]|nr:hypothetical protein [Ignavibacteria bacterium]